MIVSSSAVARKVSRFASALFVTHNVNKYAYSQAFQHVSRNSFSTVEQHKWCLEKKWASRFPRRLPARHEAQHANKHQASGSAAAGIAPNIISDCASSIGSSRAVAAAASHGARAIPGHFKLLIQQPTVSICGPGKQWIRRTAEERDPAAAECQFGWGQMALGVGEAQEE